MSTAHEDKPAPAAAERDWLDLGAAGRPRRRLGLAAEQLRAGLGDLAGALREMSRAAGARLRPLPAALSGAARAQAARIRDAPPRLRYGLAGAALLGTLAIGFLLGGAASQRAAPERAQRAGAEPATTGTLGRPVAPAPAAPDGALAGVPEVIDTATLRIEGRIARLFGVEWARGGQADDLTRYLAGRAVACRPAAEPDLYRCEVEGRDLSEAVLYNGGGLATSAATPELVAAAAHAKAERLGVWRKPAATAPPTRP